MAKNGFKIIDAELHVMEPVDLWEKYIDPGSRTGHRAGSTNGAGTFARSWKAM